jgi:hypothetical protein
LETAADDIAHRSEDSWVLRAEGSSTRILTVARCRVQKMESG